jgi:hypothetical protein
MYINFIDSDKNRHYLHNLTIKVSSLNEYGPLANDFSSKTIMGQKRMASSWL